MIAVGAAVMLPKVSVDGNTVPQAIESAIRGLFT